MSENASHCTIELSHGGRVHLGEPMKDVCRKVADARRGRGNLRSTPMEAAGFITLSRIAGDPSISKQSRSWLEFQVDASAVIAIFPIDQGSSLP